VDARKGDVAIAGIAGVVACVGVLF